MVRRIAECTHLLFLMMFISCTNPNGQDYFPMSDGSQWEYNIDYKSDQLSEGFKKAKMVIRLDGSETINGLVYQKQIITYTDIPGAETEIKYYRISKDGIYAVNEKFKNQPEYLATILPLKVGAKWVSDTPEGQFKSEVTENIPVKSGGKSYKNCLKISQELAYDFGTYTGFSYVAKNVGLIKSVLQTEGLTMTYTLEKYTK